MGQLWNRRILAAASVLALSTLGACTASLKPNSEPSISTLISGVTDGSGTVHGVLVEGSAPRESGGPSAAVAGLAVMINGGSSQQTLTAGAAFDRVIVAVPGLDDYYELTLPAGTNANVVLTASPDAYKATVTFTYAAASGTSVGPYASQAIRFIRVGTGDIQISVAWSDSADVDLHVTDPNGEEIYFGHKDAVSGGTLDLDANAACTKTTFTDGSPPAYVSNENVVWPTGSAIPGTYKVVLDYWSDCGVAQTNWVVTVARVGAAPQIFTGSFTGLASGVPDAQVVEFTQ